MISLARVANRSSPARPHHSRPLLSSSHLASGARHLHLAAQFSTLKRPKCCTTEMKPAVCGRAACVPSAPRGAGQCVRRKCLKRASARASKLASLEIKLRLAQMASFRAEAVPGPENWRDKWRHVRFRGAEAAAAAARVAPVARVQQQAARERRDSISPLAPLPAGDLCGRLGPCGKVSPRRRGGGLDWFG